MASSVGGRSRDKSDKPSSRRYSSSSRRRVRSRDERIAAPKPNVERLRRGRIAHLDSAPDARTLHSAPFSDRAHGLRRSGRSSRSGYGITREAEKGNHPSSTRRDDYVCKTTSSRSESGNTSRERNLSVVHGIEVDLRNSESHSIERTRTTSDDKPISPKRSGKTDSSSPKLSLSHQDKASSGYRNEARKHSRRDSTSSLFESLFRRQSAPPTPSAPRLVECLTCAADDVPEKQSAKLPCGHRMCHDCLKRLFEMSIKDPAHMPPKCCTRDHIPLKHVEKLFDVKFKTLWNAKYQEYHSKNRIYCPAPKCGVWIKPAYIRTSRGRKYAECQRCGMKVCALCNGKMHKGQDCPKDPEIAKLVKQAEEKGWQSCYNCKAMVELKEGCNHMTCRCLAEFCMVCGAKWKTCECPWFNNMNPAAHDQLDDWRVPEEPVQEPYDEPAPPPRRRTYTEEIANRLQQEHNDADLARRLQVIWDFDHADHDHAVLRQQDLGFEAVGLGNQARHFLNDDYVQNAANVVMSAFGDAAMGRRGEPAAGRRTGSTVPDLYYDDYDPGLVPDFLGDESVLGASRPARPRRRRWATE